MPLDQQSKSPDQKVEVKQKFAVVIDAENAQPCVLEKILSYIAINAEIVVKRIYGDFTLQANSSWHPIIQKYSLKPIQQYPNAGFKNATDIMLVIDAMDLLHSKKFDGFCIISSDSDFTSLATRLREDSLIVWGFGEKKTPESFRKACTEFFLTENFREKYKEPSNKPQAVKASVVNKATIDHQRFIAIAIKAFKLAENEHGWTTLSVYGCALRQLIPDLKFHHFTYKNLQHFIDDRKDLFEKKLVLEAQDNPNEVYFRLAKR